MTARFAGILILICLAFPARVRAVRYPVDRLQHLDGVIVREVFQDSLGFMWLATDNGLLRWEVSAFHRFHAVEGLTGPVHAIIEDDRGILLIATQNGIVGIDSQTLSAHPESPWIAHRAILKLSLDRNGDLWGGAFPGLFHLRRTETGFATDPDPAPVPGTETCHTYSLRSADDGGVWIGTNEGLYRILDETVKPMFVDQIESGHVTAITFAADGSLWVGTREPGRLYRISGERVRRFDKSDGLACGQVNVITRHPRGSVWIGTEQGVYGWTDEGFTSVDRTNGLENDDVHALFVDREEQLWIGTFGGGAFRLLSPFVTTYGMDDGLPHSAITSMARAQDGSILVGTVNGVSRFDPATGGTSLIRKGCHALAVYVDAEGTPWVSDDSGVVRLTDGATFYPPHARYLGADTDGELVVGSSTRLSRLQDGVLSPLLVFDDDTIVHATITQGDTLYVGTSRGLRRLRFGVEKVLLTDCSVTAMLLANDGRLILATSRGLGWLNGDKLGLFEHRVRGPFLTNSLVQGEQRDFWAATDIGVLRVKDGVVERFGLPDGLPSEDVRAILAGGPGILYAGTTQGLARLDITRLTPCNKAPVTRISRLMAGGHALPLHATGLSIRHADNDISVWTQQLGFRSNDGTRCQFRLIGGDDTWSAPALANDVFYANLSPGDYTLLARAIGEHGDVGEPASVSFTILKPYWQTAWFLASAGAFALAVSGIAGSLYRKRRQLRQTAEAAVHARSQFVSRMSHEIRTPLTVILACAETLSDAQLTDEAQRDCIATVLKSGKHLLGVVNDVLDLSRINSQEVEIELIPCHLPELLSEVESIAAHRSIGKSISVGLEIDRTLPAWIITDPTRLRQILINLIDNAIKFTNHGSVRLIAEWRPATTSAAGDLRLTVRDSGCGIRDAKKGVVFGAFRQEDSSITRRYGGTGLGLTIAKSLAELLGGTLTLDSQPGAGTTFTLDLPVMLPPHDPETVPGRPRREETHDRGLAGASVLVADDCDDLCRVTRIILDHAGADVECVSTGAGAVDRAGRRSFDAVLLDIHMPEMDGIAVLRTLRQHGIESPCVAISADNTDETRRRCHRAGFAGFIAKPFDREILIDSLRRSIRPAKPDGPRSRPIVAQPVVGEPPPDGDDGPIVSTLARQSAGLREAAAEFVDALARDLSRLDHALADHDTKTMLDIAHRLKGSGGIHGYLCISATAERLERHAERDEWSMVTEQIERLRRLQHRMVAGIVVTRGA